MLVSFKKITGVLFYFQKQPPEVLGQVLGLQLY